MWDVLRTNDVAFWEVPAGHCEGSCSGCCRYHRLIPGFLVANLETWLHQDTLETLNPVKMTLWLQNDVVVAIGEWIQLVGFSMNPLTV